MSGNIDTEIIREEETRTAVDMEDILAHADYRVLLMCLVHLTGDSSWLDAPFSPRRDIRLIPDPHAGLSEEAIRKVQEATMAFLEKGTGAPAVHDPGNALMRRMMSVTLGEDVPAEYAPMMREELNFVSRAYPGRIASSNVRQEQAVMIVGAGVCGIALGVRLKELDIPFVILEQDVCVGGVWHRNRYPGCGVDTPNHSYSYSFGKRYPWTRYFSPREEIFDYLNQVANDHDLLPHIRFNTTVEKAVWDESAKQWNVTLRDLNGQHIETSRIFVSAIGQLSDPTLPNIEGQKQFQGISFHSMNWPEGLDVSGKRVAVIGTGATAMQLVPTISSSAAKVDVYQRSAQWVRPIEGYADPIKPGAQWLLQHMPYYAEWFRFNMLWRYGDGLLPCLRRDPNWPDSTRSINKTNDRHRVEMTAFITEKLAGRDDLIDKCVPDYPPYGKRILLDNKWYDTLLKPNVELVTDRIDHISESGIVMDGGDERAADIIVYATGFKLTEMAARLNIHGSGGVRLEDAWAGDDPKAYLGLTVSGFPNFFCMLGPNSGPAHGGSVIFQAECQVRYITGCLVKMSEQDITSIDVKQDVLEQHVRELDAEHETLVWTHPSVSTYYRNAQGRVFSAMPWRFVDYWSMTHEPNLDDYLRT